MFTGIIEEVGKIISNENSIVRIQAEKVIEDVAIGDSIAVNGCCLTVIAYEHSGVNSWWEAAISEETRTCTTFSTLKKDTDVNLERAMLLGGRLGGHIVQGHVDGIGEVLEPVPNLAISLPNTLRKYLTSKGSITVDGVSLTLASVTESGFTCAIIPHTALVTTLGSKKPGDMVNIEIDIVAKQVFEFTKPYQQAKT